MKHTEPKKVMYRTEHLALNGLGRIHLPLQPLLLTATETEQLRADVLESMHLSVNVHICISIKTMFGAQILALWNTVYCSGLRIYFGLFG